MPSSVASVVVAASESRASIATRPRGSGATTLRHRPRPVVNHSAAPLPCSSTAAAADLSARAGSVCADNDIPFFLPYCRFLRSAALAQDGDTPGGLAGMLESLAEQQAVNGSFFCDVILAFIAIACGQARRWDEGLRHVEEG